MRFSDKFIEQLIHELPKLLYRVEYIDYNMEYWQFNAATGTVYYTYSNYNDTGVKEGKKQFEEMRDTCTLDSLSYHTQLQILFNLKHMRKAISDGFFQRLSRLYLPQLLLNQSSYLRGSAPDRGRTEHIILKLPLRYLP